jgi:aminopeptidase I
LSERQSWSSIKKGGKYYVTRNGSSLIAFSIGSNYSSGDGIAMIASHIDAVSAKLKPVSVKPTKAGYVQLGVAPYAGSLNTTWWDRDLSIGGRLIVKGEDGTVSSKLVKFDYPIARVPSLAPHFGVGMLGTNNPETQAVPIIGLDNSDLSLPTPSTLFGSSPFTAQTENATAVSPALNLSSTPFSKGQPSALLKAIAEKAGVSESSIINWELELFDSQPAQLGGLKKDFIFGGRIDDKLCSYAAVEGFLAAPNPDKSINLVSLFDDEEIGSLLRQGARGNFLPATVERIVEAFHGDEATKDATGRTYANSFLVSADVTHAANPNFLEKYLEGHAPRLNVGVTVSCDSNGHMTTDAVSHAFFNRCAELAGQTTQLFQIRNDSRSGGTVGPMLSSAMGVRAIDVGIPQLSMHSVRATTGSLDPGLGVKCFEGFYKNFEKVGGEFQF